MEFFMQDAAGRRHPLHIALADDASAPGRVAVLHLPVVHQSHSLEAPVRVLAHAATVARVGLKGTGRRIVEQQEGAARRHLCAVVVEHAMDGKTVPHPVARGGTAGGNDAFGIGHEKVSFRFCRGRESTAPRGPDVVASQALPSRKPPTGSAVMLRTCCLQALPQGAMVVFSVPCVER